MKSRFVVFAFAAVGLFSASLFAEGEGPMVMEAGGANMVGVLLDRVKSGVRQPTRFEDGRSGIVHLEYAEMPDEKWQQVRWIVRFPTAPFAGRKAARATLNLVLYTVIGEDRPPLRLELIEGGQGPMIIPADRAISGGVSLEVVVPEQLPADLGIDVTPLVNEAIEMGHDYVAFRISASAPELQYPVEGATVYYFVGEQNPEGWKRSEVPQLHLQWEP